MSPQPCMDLSPDEMPNPSDKLALEVQAGVDASSGGLSNSNGRKRSRHPNTKRKRAVRTSIADESTKNEAADAPTAVGNAEEFTESGRNISRVESKLSTTAIQNNALKARDIKRYNVRERLPMRVKALRTPSETPSIRSPSIKESNPKDLKPEDFPSLANNGTDRESQVRSTDNTHPEVQPESRSSYASEKIRTKDHGKREGCNEIVRNIPQATYKLIATTRQQSAPKKKLQIFKSNGEVVSKSRWRRSLAKARDEKMVESSEYEGVLALNRSSADSSEQQPSHISSIKNNPENSIHPSRSSPDDKDTSAEPYREQLDDIMSPKGGIRRGKFILT